MRALTAPNLAGLADAIFAAAAAAGYDVIVHVGAPSISITLGAHDLGPTDDVDRAAMPLIQTPPGFLGRFSNGTVVGHVSIRDQHYTRLAALDTLAAQVVTEFSGGTLRCEEPEVDADLFRVPIAA